MGIGDVRAGAGGDRVDHRVGAPPGGRNLSVGARFVYRMDDIAPAMDWVRFRRFLDLFRKHGVVPLLGVVPDNRDPGLEVGPEEPRFWDILRALVDEGAVEIAQHGTHHLYTSEAYGVFGRAYGFLERSEVAGLSEEEQRETIGLGRKLLEDRGLAPRFWMSPSHTFDRVTLRVLAGLGFEAVTDGIALYPFDLDGVTLVPQQLWAPKNVRLGVWTVCLHANTTDEALFEQVARHLASGAEIVPFSVAAKERPTAARRLANAAFRAAYRVHIARHRARARRSSGPGDGGRAE